MPSPPAKNGDSSDSSAFAPVHSVPVTRVVSIEHPCIIKNLENGLKSLGGEAQIKHTLVDPHTGGDEDGDDEPSLPTLGVSLRPSDPFAKKIQSTAVQTHNVLLKVTLPKQTGRKRKRGSNEPFVHVQGPMPRSTVIAAPDLLQRIRDNKSTYQLQPVGTIPLTQRFHNLPDLQMTAADLPIMREIRNHAMKPSYASLKQFSISTEPHITHDTFVAPPDFLPPSQPYTNAYTQYIAQPKPTLTSLLLPTDPFQPAPSAPDPSLPSPPPRSVALTLPLIQHILAERPLVTQRILLQRLPRVTQKDLLSALPYLTYHANHGPWRSCHIKFGLDPRTAPATRIYQTLRVDVAAGRQRGPASRLRRPRRRRRRKDDWTFDGRSVSHPHKMYQLCDLTEPLLRDLVETGGELREVCDVAHWGWYWNGTMAKIRVLMREMVTVIMAGGEEEEEEEEEGERTRVWLSVAALPERIECAQDLGGLVGDGEVQNGYLKQVVEDVRRIAMREGKRRMPAARQRLAYRALGGIVDAREGDVEEGDGIGEGGGGSDEDEIGGDEDIVGDDNAAEDEDEVEEEEDDGVDGEEDDDDDDDDDEDDEEQEEGDDDNDDDDDGDEEDTTGKENDDVNKEVSVLHQGDGEDEDDEDPGEDLRLAVMQDDNHQSPEVENLP